VLHLCFQNELLVLSCPPAGTSVQAEGSMSVNLYVHFIQNFIEPFCFWHNLTFSFLKGVPFL